MISILTQIILIMIFFFQNRASLAYGQNGSGHKTLHRSKAGVREYNRTEGGGTVGEGTVGGGGALTTLHLRVYLMTWTEGGAFHRIGRELGWRPASEMVTLTGEKAMQSHLTKTLKDGAVYEKVAEEHCVRGFCRDIKQVFSKLKNMLAFLHF